MTDQHTPDGWKLVPVEPTPGWIAALSGKGLRIGKLESAIEDMLAAAPTPPAAAQKAEPSDEHVSVVGMPEFDALLDHIYEHGTTSEGVRSRADALARALLARYGRPAGDAQPVAWRYQTPTGWHATTDAGKVLAIKEHHPVEALYAAPVAAQAQPDYPGATVADRLDAMADDCAPGSQRAADLRAAATVWRKHLAGPAAPVAAQASGQSQDAEDAARYRWLRSDRARVANVIDREYAPGYWEYRCGEELDAAIDAAMQRTSGDDHDQR